MIYVVEDDPGIRELECYALKQAGFEVCGFEEGGAFWAAVRAHLPQLVLLDVMLPGEDGNQLLMRLKQDPRTRSVPVIMVTARGEEMDKVQSLDGGADDYIVKPFGVMELLSRVRAVLRRAGKEQPGELAAGGLRMDVERHRVYADGRDVTLTHMEFELLHYLLLNRVLQGSFFRFLEHQAAPPWYQTTKWVSENLAQHFDMAQAYPGLAFIIYGAQIALYFLTAAALFYGLWRGTRTCYLVYGAAYLIFTYFSGWMISGGRYMLGCVPLFLIAADIKSARAGQLLLAASALLFALYTFLFLQGYAIM